MQCFESVKIRVIEKIVSRRQHLCQFDKTRTQLRNGRSEFIRR